MGQEEARAAADAAARKYRNLRRRKWLATALLVVAGAVFIATAVLGAHAGYGVVGLVRAMAEAALIGGLADWYAVVALFRHPLGVPLPHTAIVPRKQDAIGRNLADFICDHFLASEQIIGRIRAADPALKLAAYLSTPRSAAKFADVAATLASNLVGLLDNAALQDLVWRTARKQLAVLDVAGLLAQLLDALTHDGRHRDAVNSLLDTISEYVDQPEVRSLLAKKIAAELWAVVRFVKLDRMVADNLADKVATAIRELIHAMAENPNHPLRQRFDDQIPHFIDRLRTDESLRGEVRAFYEGLLANRELAGYTKHLYHATVARIRRDLASPDSAIHRQVANGSMALGRELEQRPALRTWFNDWLVTTLTPLADRYRETFRAYVAGRVHAWGTDELTRRLELGIGSDLQWIRYNGTAVGAAIGAALYGLIWAVHLLTG